MERHGTRDRKSVPELQNFAGKIGLFPAMTHSDCTPSLAEGSARSRWLSGAYGVLLLSVAAVSAPQPIDLPRKSGAMGHHDESYPGFDWIMSRDDLELMVSLVNHNTPGAAEFVELPATGHTFEHYSSQQAAFSGKALPFDDQIAGRITGWFERHP